MMIYYQFGITFQSSTNTNLTHKYKLGFFPIFYSFTGSLPHHSKIGGEKRDSGIAGSSVGADSSSAAPGRRMDWWESASNKLYTIATDKTISKLMKEYKRRKQPQQVQQSHINLFMKEQGRAEAGGRGQSRDTLELQRLQQLVDQQGSTLRHSVSAGPEVLRQENRPRLGSGISSHSISLRDSEAQIQVGLIQIQEELHNLI